MCPEALINACKHGLTLDEDDVTYFLGRETLIVTKAPGMAMWRERLFALMARNAVPGADVLQAAGGARGRARRDGGNLTSLSGLGVVGGSGVRGLGGSGSGFGLGLQDYRAPNPEPRREPWMRDFDEARHVPRPVAAGRGNRRGRDRHGRPAVARGVEPGNRVDQLPDGGARGGGHLASSGGGADLDCRHAVPQFLLPPSGGQIHDCRPA